MAALVLVILAAAGLALGQDLGEAEQLEFADGLYARGLYEACIPEYEAFLEAFPESPARDAVYFRLGESCRHTGDVSAAEKYFKRVFDEYPESPFRLKAGFRRADLFMQAGYHDAAVELFKRVVQEEPPPDLAAASFYLMGDAYRELDRPDAARIAYARVREAFPESEFYPYALLKLGELAAPEDPAEALALYARAAADTNAPARVTAEALFQSAELQYEQGAYEASAAAYQRLRREFPADARAREAALRTAWSLYRAGLYAETLRVADAVLNRPEREGEPDPAAEAEWLYLKANAQRALLKREAARETYARLIERHPDSRYADAARYENALVHFKMGEFEGAIEWARGVRADAARGADVYWLLAESYAALDRHDDALQYYRLILKDFPDSAMAGDAAYRIAYHLQSQGRYAEAASRFLETAQRFADSETAPKALFAAALCASQDGRYDDAARDWGALIRRYPEHDLVEDALYQKAMSEIRLERDETALVTVRALLQRFPETPYAAEAWYWQGVLLSQAEQWADAQAALRRALAASPRPELARDAEFRLATVLQRTGAAGEAADRFEALLDTPSVERFAPALLQWLSETRYAEQAFERAEAAARVMTEEERAPSVRETGWTLVGRARLAREDTAGAAAAFENALATGAGTRFGAESALRLGDLALARGDAAGAGAYYKRAASGAGETAPGIRARAYAGLGRAAAAGGDPAGAARYFMSVAVLYDDPEIVP
ncbi:MAG: tetratricopeptide repeat protein, partial [Lentisphaerae bacterium]|nr:tetratricopeptide repeat protein [Lentisphaerota bacterium]